MSIRLGIVSFLNTKPLVYPLLHGQMEHPFDIVLATPARLAEQLREGKLDVALIPAIEYARAEGYKIIPDISICATGPVKSVLLYFKNSLKTVKKVALDDASCTSATLVRIMLSRCFDIHPKYSVSTSPSKDLSNGADAALLIGDQALIHSAGENHCLDLSATWYAYTGQPFVFALFAVRPGVDLGDSIDILRRAKQWGLNHVDEIAAEEAPGVKLPVEICRDYLSRRIGYDLNGQHLLALKTFYDLAYQEGLLDREASLTFYP